MVEKYSGFKASTGAIFESEFDAWKDEFRVWLKRNGIDNDAIANNVVKAVDDGRPDSLDYLSVIIGGMRAHAPNVPAILPYEHPPLIRCMGGKFCDHAPGICTALMTNPSQRTRLNLGLTT